MFRHMLAYAFSTSASIPCKQYMYSSSLTTRIASILFAALFLVSCSSSDKSASEQLGSPRKLDPDAKPIRSGLGTKSRTKAKLYTVQTSKQLELPPDLVSSVNAGVRNNIQSFDIREERILPEVIGARVVQDGDERWLEVDADVESTWKAVMEYWALSNVNLVEYNPEAGLMETDWIEEAEYEDEESGSRMLRLASDLITQLTNRKTTLDRYRVRFERLSDSRTALHVGHRSIAKKGIHYARKLSRFEWVELESDPTRVAALLQNLVLLFDQPEAEPTDS